MQQICEKLTLDEAWQTLLDNEKKIRTNCMKRVRRDLKNDCWQEICLCLPHMHEKFNPEITSFRNYLFNQCRWIILTLCNKTTKIGMKTKVYNFENKKMQEGDESSDGTGVNYYANRNEKYVYEYQDKFDFNEYISNYYKSDINIYEIVSTLSLRHRVVFILQNILGYKYDQIAEILGGIAKSGVMTIARETRNEIKKHYEET